MSMSGNATPREQQLRETGGSFREEPSPRQRTPPTSARPRSARFSSKTQPYTSSLACRTPRTPRVSQEPLTVAIRIKPPLDRREAVTYHVADSNLMLEGPTSGGLDPSSPQEEIRRYEFSSIFGPEAHEDSISQLVIPKVLEQLRSGYNTTVMCYGQTGSGKTYTVQELLPRVVEQVFTTLNTHDREAGFTFVVEMSFVQIYNGNVYNLLEDGKGEFGEPLPKPKGLLVPEPLVVVNSAEDVMGHWDAAQKKRATTAHQMNARSSRSHCLFSLHVAKVLDGTPVQGSKITIVDLAGSERLNKTGAGGGTKDEAIHINKSLTGLRRVIDAIAEGNANPPYRDNVLTLYLAQSLADACNIIVACISVEVMNYGETKTTLEFATTAKKCVVTRSKAFERIAARSGNFDAICSQLQREIATLKQKMDALQQEADLERQRTKMLITRLQEEEKGSSRTSPTTSSPAPFAGAPPLGSSHQLHRTDSSGGVEVDAARKRIQQLEHSSLSFMTLLREREQELRQIEARRSEADSLAEELKSRLEDKEEARALLARILDEKETDLVALQERLSQLNETFLWQEEQCNSANERTKVLETTVTQLQTTLRSQTEELHQANVNALKWEQQLEEVKLELMRLGEQKSHLAAEYDALDLKYQREKNERQMEFKVGQLDRKNDLTRRSELERMRAAIAEQGSLMQSMEQNLAKSQEDLLEALKAKSKAEERANAAEHAYRNYDRRAASNTRLSSVGQFTGSEPLPPGTNPYEILALNKKITTQELRLTKLNEQLQTRDFHIEELTHQLEVSRQELANKENECRCLEQLEQAHSLKGEQFERRLEEVYNELDANISNREALEKQLDVRSKEVAQMDDDYRNSMLEIERLQTQMEDLMSRLRKYENSNDELSARLREAEEEANSAKREITAEHQRVKELEDALKERELESAQLLIKLETGHRQHANLSTLVANRRKSEKQLFNKLSALGANSHGTRTAQQHQATAARLHRDGSSRQPAERPLSDSDEAMAERTTQRLESNNRSQKIKNEVRKLSKDRQVAAVSKSGFSEGPNVFHQTSVHRDPVIIETPRSARSDAASSTGGGPIHHHSLSMNSNAPPPHSSTVVRGYRPARSPNSRPAPTFKPPGGRTVVGGGSSATIRTTKTSAASTTTSSTTKRKSGGDSSSSNGANHPPLSRITPSIPTLAIVKAKG